MNTGSKLPGSFDARDWAAEWLETIRKSPSIPTDEGTMITWFSNAIMAGYDEHARKHKYARAIPVSELRAFVAKLRTEAAEWQISSQAIESRNLGAAMTKDAISKIVSEIASELEALLNKAGGG